MIKIQLYIIATSLFYVKREVTKIFEIIALPTKTRYAERTLILLNHK